MCARARASAFCPVSPRLRTRPAHAAVVQQAADAPPARPVTCRLPTAAPHALPWVAYTAAPGLLMPRQLALGWWPLVARTAPSGSGRRKLWEVGEGRRRCVLTELVFRLWLTPLTPVVAAEELIRRAPLACLPWRRRARGRTYGLCERYLVSCAAPSRSSPSAAEAVFHSLVGARSSPGRMPSALPLPTAPFACGHLRPSVHSLIILVFWLGHPLALLPMSLCHLPILQR